MANVEIGNSDVPGIPGHFSETIDNDLKKVYPSAKDAFYNLANLHGLFDTDDENSPLSPQQKTMVPIADRHHISDLSAWISDCIYWALGEVKSGILTNTVGHLINALDAHATKTTAGLDAYKNALTSGAAAVPGLNALVGAANAASLANESLQATVQMTNPFAAYFLPSIPSINFPGLPYPFSNLFKKGQYHPNYNLIYEFELVKNPRFYFNTSGVPCIGAGVPVKMSKSNNAQKLAFVYSLLTADSQGNPIGDTANGISQAEFEMFMRVSEMTSKDQLLADPDAPSFSLTDTQMQLAHMKYVLLAFWQVVTNENNWAYGHWGSVVHNAMPSAVKTALASYVWSTGMAIDPDINPQSGFISYWAEIGLYYLIGYPGRTALYGIKDVDVVLNKDGSLAPVDATGDMVAEYGFPKDARIAKTYFQWIADLLLRLTYEHLPAEAALNYRKRRHAEAGLIMSYLGKPMHKFAETPEKLPKEQQVIALIERHFHEAVNGTVLRFPNEGVPGGEGVNNSLATPSDNATKITFATQDIAEKIKPVALNILSWLSYKAGLTELMVGSLNITPDEQCRLMFNAMNTPSPVFFRGLGARVCQAYLDYCSANGFGQSAQFSRYVRPDGEGDWRSNPVFIPTDNPDYVKHAKAALAAMKKEMDGVTDFSPLSPYCADPATRQVIAILPDSLRPASKRSQFIAICKNAVRQGFLLAFSNTAKNLRLDISPTISGFDAASYKNDKLPEVAFKLSNNPYLTNPKQWQVPFVADVTNSIALS